MKLRKTIVLLALTALSIVSAVKESIKVQHHEIFSDESNTQEDRKLRKKPKKTSRSFRRTIKPVGDPESVSDEDGNVKRRRSVVDLRQLLLDDDDDDVDIQLMNDEESQSLKMRRDDGREDPFESWFGRDETTGNQLTMVRTATIWGETVTTGTMYGKNGTVYQIRTLADGDVVAEEVKPMNFDMEKEGPRTDVEGDDDVDPETIDEIDGLPDGGRRGRRNLRRLDSSSQIDIMVLYTKGAMCAAAGFGSVTTCTASTTNLAKIEGVITLAVAETNKAYTLSGIPTKLRLVKTHFDASYNEKSFGWDNTLGNLRNNGDGQLDYVHAMRDQFGADFVAMIVDIGSYCGIGYMPATPTAGDAFSLVQWNCATGYYSFGHELAHNMGCNHDVKNAGGATSGLNYGYQSPAAKFRTIMSYDCSPSCPRIQYFSNPSVNYNGQVVGSSQANNVQAIKNNLSAFANYRQAVVTSTPTAGPSTPISSPTPAPTVAVTMASPTFGGSLTTALTGGYVGAAGNMIDIKAITNIYVANFAVHATSASTVTIEVYKKITTGTCVGSQFDSSKWQLIGRSTFVSTAAYSPTILPKGTFSPVYVAAGTIQSFYITFVPTTNLNRYSAGSTVGSIQASNSDLQILQGMAKEYPFKADFSPRAWNGIVYYQKASFDSNKPTAKPTPKPSTARPTGKPTSSSAASKDNLIQLKTTFAGGNGQAGNMVEIQATKNIVVKSFDIHTYSTGSVHAFVYFKKGSYLGFERNPSAWTKIADTWVVGRGSPNPTPIPDKDVADVSIKAGETYSFYVTLADSSIRYTNGMIPVQDSSVKVIRSHGNKYPFGENYADRLWNGILNYVPAAGTTRELTALDEFVDEDEDHSVDDQASSIQGDSNFPIDQ